MNFCKQESGKRDLCIHEDCRMWSCSVEDHEKNKQNARQDSESESELKQCQELITQLVERSESWPFQRPVSRKEVRDGCFTCQLCAVAVTRGRHYSPGKAGKPVESGESESESDYGEVGEMGKVRENVLLPVMCEHV